MAVSFRILVEILSGTLAFVGSRFFNNFSTPSFVNIILAIGVISPSSLVGISPFKREFPKTENNYCPAKVIAITNMLKSAGRNFIRKLEKKIPFKIGLLIKIQYLVPSVPLISDQATTNLL